MRYVEIDDVIFTDINGNSRTVKDIRPLEQLETLTSVPIDVGTTLDEIASRPEIFGEGTEGSSYRIFDHNALALADANFEIDRLKTIRIPLT